MNPANARIARCRECRRRAAAALDSGAPVSDPFAQDPPVSAATPTGGDGQNILADPEFIQMLERGHARTLIKKARRGFFGSVYYYAIVHGKRVESDDEEQLVAWIVDQL